MLRSKALLMKSGSKINPDEGERCWLSIFQLIIGLQFGLFLARNMHALH